MEGNCFRRSKYPASFSKCSLLDVSEAARPCYYLKAAKDYAKLCMFDLAKEAFVPEIASTCAICMR
jgi:hypothetical protein